MQDAASATTREEQITQPAELERAEAPTVTDYAAGLLSAALLIVSFSDFDFWPLAWVALVPLLVVVARKPAPWRAFLLSWLTGAIFFFGSCYWLTYSMVRYGHVPAPIAYLLLVPGALVLGIFPGIFSLALARAITRWGARALVAAPFLWSSLEWARLAVTGQLWNALGYSQAYHPISIQPARWGGVFAISFMIVSVNAAVTFAVLKRNARAIATACIVILAVVGITTGTFLSLPTSVASASDTVFVALQPNVPGNPAKSADELQDLVDRHVAMSKEALAGLKNDQVHRVVIWPESPMNFAYASDAEFRAFIGNFTRSNRTSVLFNSLEPAPGDGSYNSALLVNVEGRLVAQYDKIRLLPFGEYVPLPHWLPGASWIAAIVGDFTPGTRYTLMPVGSAQAGVFICIESAYPSIARTFTANGADVLINISNDGYLGPTAVMHQHLANAIFRAVENGRPLLRVTNTGISAYIEPDGEVRDSTEGFQSAVRTWTITRAGGRETFYTRHGDLFVLICCAISLTATLTSFRGRRQRAGHGIH